MGSLTSASEKRRDARPHGVTHHVGAGEIEVIEQRA